MSCSISAPEYRWSVVSQYPTCRLCTGTGYICNVRPQDYFKENKFSCKCPALPQSSGGKRFAIQISCRKTPWRYCTSSDAWDKFTNAPPHEISWEPPHPLHTHVNLFLVVRTNNQKHSVQYCTNLLDNKINTISNITLSGWRRDVGQDPLLHQERWHCPKPRTECRQDEIRSSSHGKPECIQVCVHVWVCACVRACVLWPVRLSICT